MRRADKKGSNKSVTFNSIVVSLALLFSGYIAGYVVNRLDRKAREMIKEEIKKIILPSPVNFHESITGSQVILNPVKSGIIHDEGEFTNQKEVLLCCKNVAKKTVLKVTANARSGLDRIRYRKRPAGKNTGIGFMVTRIFIDDMKCSEDSSAAVEPLMPDLSTHCSHSVILEPGHYKIRVESIYYGFLVRPGTKVTIHGVREGDIPLLDLLEKGEEELKKRTFLHGKKRN